MSAPAGFYDTTPTAPDLGAVEGLEALPRSGQQQSLLQARAGDRDGRRRRPRRRPVRRRQGFSSRASPNACSARPTAAIAHDPRAGDRNGTILDGSGDERLAGDVAIEDGRIAGVGAVPQTECPEIDASGLFVAPGFIDIHSHSDYTLLVDPRAMSAIYQGVTLEVVGNCGFGCFPIREAGLARKAIYGYSEEVPIEWSTAGGYFERLQAARPAVNVSASSRTASSASRPGLADRPADTASWPR